MIYFQGCHTYIGDTDLQQTAVGACVGVSVSFVYGSIIAVTTILRTSMHLYIYDACCKCNAMQRSEVNPTNTTYCW